MPTRDDLLFGQIAAKRQMVKAEQVNLCLQIQAADEAAGSPRRSLGQIMVERGLITSAQLDLILEAQRELSGPRMIGKYQLMGKLGEGGMGAVYRAVIPDTGLQVALKILPKKFAAEASYVSRFRREASVGLGLDHPNVVHTFELGEDKGVHFIALELVAGGDLEKRIRQRGVFPEQEALAIVREIALGLQHAHAKGLVHRDIKPQNILFDAEGHPKLSDLGLVKMTDLEASHLTQSGMMVGTPHYIAPEQARGEADIDLRADIYALGATLYRMVTGKTPFDGSTPLEIISKHLNQELVAPDELNPALSDGCTAIIEKMMAKDREDRYAATAEFIQDIDAVLAGRPLESAELEIGKSSVQISARRRARLPARKLAVVQPAQESRKRMRRAVSEKNERPRSAPDSAMPLKAGAGAAIACALVAALYFSSSGPTSPAQTGDAHDSASAVHPEKPAQAVPAPTAPPPTPVAAPGPETPAPALAHGQTVQTREQLAQDAFDSVAKGDAAGRKGRLEAFLKEYGDTIVASRARVLLEEASRPVPPAEHDIVYLTDLPEQDVSVLSNATWAFGKHGRWKNFPINFNGVPSPHALGTHPVSDYGSGSVSYILDKQFVQFRTAVGISDSSNTEFRGTIIFKVLGDGAVLWTSKTITAVQQKDECAVSVADVRRLTLVATCPAGSAGAHAVWLEPRVQKKTDTPGPPQASASLWSRAFDREEDMNAVEKGVSEATDIFGTRGTALKSVTNNNPDAFFTSMIRLKFDRDIKTGNDTWIRFALRPVGAHRIAIQTQIGEGLYEKYFTVKEGEWQWITLRMSEYDKKFSGNGPALPTAGMSISKNLIYGVGNKNPTTLFVSQFTIGDGPLPAR